MFDEKTKKYYGEWAEQIAEEKGRKKAIKERNLEIAKAMLNEKLSIDLIMRTTGLTKEEILNLKD